MQTSVHCKRLVIHILDRWDPPASDRPLAADISTCCKTACMSGLLWAMGEDFPWELLSESQADVMNESEVVFLRALSPPGNGDGGPFVTG